jgi:hypothetical protein
LPTSNFLSCQLATDPKVATSETPSEAEKNGSLRILELLVHFLALPQNLWVTGL